MSLREDQITNFLANTPWQSARRHALNQDASFRRYWRLEMNNKSAMLMDAPPPEKSVKVFADIANFLREQQLLAPQIYKMDNASGLMLIEDFGDDTFTRILRSDPQQENALYDLAIDTLITLHQIKPQDTLPLPPYDTATLIDEAQLLTDWFYPAQTGRPLSPTARSAYTIAWQTAIRALKPHRTVVVLRDYHVDNLMRIAMPGITIPGAQAPRCGLLDFQDALMGSPAYDLMSLIEDARRDISRELKNHCLQRYFSAMSEQRNFPTQQELMPWLNLLAAQRHAKVLGIFVRLFKRDGKANYLEHLPRILALYRSALAREPALAPVHHWMEEYLPLKGLTLALS